MSGRRLVIGAIVSGAGLSLLMWGGMVVSAAETTYYRMAPDGQVVGKTVSEWLAGLSDRDPDVRRETAALFQWVDDAEARVAIPQLVQLLQDPEVQDVAANTLQYLDPTDVMPALLQAIRSHGQTVGRHDAAVRSQRLAAAVLGSFAWRSDEAADAALSVLQDRALHVVVRAAVCDGLGQMGHGATKPVPALLAVVRQADEDPYLREDARHALEQLGVDPSSGEMK